MVIDPDGTGNELGDHNSNVVKLFGRRRRSQPIAKWWPMRIRFGGGLLGDVCAGHRGPRVCDRRPGQESLVFPAVLRAPLGLPGVAGIGFDSKTAL